MQRCIITSCIININAILALIIILFVCLSSACPNGCSSRGLCVDGVCQCAEGLLGPDCSTNAALIPSPYSCPECYEVTVGPAMYYYGPSWRLPDGPIVGLNYKGNLSVLQGNGDVQVLSRGPDIENWEASPIITMKEGRDFDECGAWLMRAFTDGDKIRAFYHAERACNYNAQGQTRKSGGYAESTDGGMNYVKPNYPNNMILDTSTRELPNRPSGEGDYGVTRKDDYYYMYFSNVENNTIGVARSTVASGGLPGTWWKYYDGAWNEPGLGGKHTPLNNISGTQAYLHTPSDSFLTVGAWDAYFKKGTTISVSDNGIDWKHLGDPLVGGDFAVNNDMVLYQSLIGKTAGYDVGSQFDLYYMWVAPGDTWSTRYQIRRSVTMNYVGKSKSPFSPSTKLALTSYTNRKTGKRVESIEMPKFPFMPSEIIGYIMTRPYPNTFPIYECYNQTADDFIVGTGDHCFGTNIVTTRVAGHIWATRMDRSIAIYRCLAPKDTFLSHDPACEGKAPSQEKPFGYVMSGPDVDPALMARDIPIAQGTEWKFVSGSEPSLKGSSTWYMSSYDDSKWNRSLAPFASGYGGGKLGNTVFGRMNYYFRQSFTVDTTRTLTRLVVSVASDDFSYIYFNGQLIDKDVVTHHEAAYWNRQIFVPLSLVNKSGPNVVAVLTKNSDNWAFFDAEVTARYSEASAQRTAASLTCPSDCGVMGQCISGRCVCDQGWTGPACSISYCSYSETVEDNVVNRGALFRHTQWNWVPSTPANWFVPTYSDSWWHEKSAPFGSSSYSNKSTSIPVVRVLYRKTITLNVPRGKTIMQGKLSIASDANHRIWVNGVFIGAPISPIDLSQNHAAEYWNEIFSVKASLLKEGSNVIAVEVNPSTNAFFDMTLQVTYGIKSCVLPTPAPTLAPTPAPTRAPTSAPTAAPTPAPTRTPTPAPTAAPTPAPTRAPTLAPTSAPTPAPTRAPTASPTQAPTQAPTKAPTQAATAAPTRVPTQAATQAPTRAPTQAATVAPTRAPTQAATQAPTQAPTRVPTQAATQAPTRVPTQPATQAPTRTPTQPATQAPTRAPTQVPTETPSHAPISPSTSHSTNAPTSSPPSSSPTSGIPGTPRPAANPTTLGVEDFSDTDDFIRTGDGSKLYGTLGVVVSVVCTYFLLA